ncbi:MAG: hypothetical protein ACQESC_00170 [Nanobdellota archaeon]
MQSRNMSLNRKYILIVGMFILLGLSVIAIILLLRTHQGAIIAPGQETFSHLNSAREITSDTATSYLFYDVILGWLLSICSVSTAMIIFPTLLFIVTMILFTEILRLEKVSNELILYTVGFLILSPAIMLMYVGFTAYALTLLLSVLIMYLYVRKSSWYFAVVPFLFFVDKIVGLIAIVLLFLLENVRGDRKKQLVGLGVTTIILLLLSGFFPSLSLASFTRFFSIQPNTLFSFFGGTFGFPFILLFLGIVGMLISKQSFSITRRQSLIFVFLILSLFYTPLRLISMLILAYYSAIAFKFLLSRKWGVWFLKSLTLILIVCILVFSTSTTFKETINKNPRSYEVIASETIASFVDITPSLQESYILTHPSYDEYVEFYSSLEVFPDEQKSYTILSSQKFSFVEQELQDNKISFIIVDTSRKKGNLWQRSDQGILFVFQNTRLFKKVFEHGDYAVYYYTQWDKNKNE